jgi:uncharacterized protein YdaU (DUF1376 family)
MNYYEHHLGDYIRDTIALSMLEEGAYRRLLDAYYVREAPLPADRQECCRLARATTRPERKAVEYVLDHFFTTSAEGYRQSRADRVIAEYHAFIEKQRANGRASAAKRALNQPPNDGGNQKSTTVEPPLPSGSNDGGVLVPTKTQPPTSHLPLPKEEGESPSPGNGKTKPRKTRLPDDFALTPELEQYASDRLPSVNLPELLASFRGKAEAKGWEYVKWGQAFQEYVRNCAPNSGHWAAGQYPRKGQHSGGWM